jgi:competence protein ComEA
LIVVHVVGAVKQPGVYELAPESRVLAAIQCAGGLTQEAAPEALNLAAKVTDGEQVAVPTRKEVESGDAGPGAGSAPAGTGGSAAGAPTGKVNVNTADATQLDALPGVGPSTAAKIVADRQSNGPFASPDELGRVPGIGPKKLEQLKVLISVR